MIPVFIGLAASHNLGEINWVLATLTLLGAVLAHAGSNVLNDVYDHRSGTDIINMERVFPFSGGSRVIQDDVLSETQMTRFGWLLLGCSACIGLLLLHAGGWLLLGIGAAGLFLGWAYTAPPLRLVARGLGEPAIGVGFGILIPVGTACVQTGDWSPLATWAGLPYGLLVMLILIINEFPDVVADAATAKRNWVVRLGRRRAAGLYAVVAVTAVCSLCVGVIVGGLPLATLFVLIPMGCHISAWRHLRNHYNAPGTMRGAITNTLLGSFLAGTVLALTLAFGG